MDEHILACGALDKSITLCSVKPLYGSLLSHRETPLPFREEFIPPPPVEASGISRWPPLKKISGTGRVTAGGESFHQNNEGSEAGHHVKEPRREALELEIGGENLYRLTQKRQPSYPVSLPNFQQ
jgi:hypothetical protein